MFNPTNSTFGSRFGARKKVVLFLCTGNTCRSPMAAAYLRKLLQDRKILEVEVRSAGVMTVTGLRASQEATQIMESEGVDLAKHRSSQLSTEMVRKADLILGMTPLHVQEALRLCKEARGKAYLLKEFTRSDLDKIQIDDPMGATLEVFKKCFREIKDACDVLVDSDFVTGGRKRRAPVVEVPTEVMLKPSKKKTVQAPKQVKAAKKAPVVKKKAAQPKSAPKTTAARKESPKTKATAKPKAAARVKGRAKGAAAKAK